MEADRRWIPEGLRQRVPSIRVYPDQTTPLAGSTQMWSDPPLKCGAPPERFAKVQVRGGH